MCMLNDCDDMVTLLAENDYKAKKDHRCAECGRTIHAGESYHRDTFIFEGRRQSHKTCGHCMVARNWLRGECGGWVYTAVEEDVREHCHSGHRYAYGVYRLAVGMRQKWTRRNGSLMSIPAMPITTHERLEAPTP